MIQQGLFEQRSSSCPFVPYLDEHDHHCFDCGLGRPGYEVLAEDKPGLDLQLALVRGVSFDNITAKQSNLPLFPTYIPLVTRGSKTLFAGLRPPVIAVTLNDVLSEVELKTPDDIRARFGAPVETKIILLCFGLDRLLETLWRERRVVLPKLAVMGFDAVTSVNYSVWDDQPHAERLFNLKRSLITYEIFQSLGVPCIPHVYWSGTKDLDRWAKWFKDNPVVQTFAIDLQTLRMQRDWDRAILELNQFSFQLPSRMNILISGPQTPSRIDQVKEIFPNLSLTNGTAAIKAFASRIAELKNGELTYIYSPEEKWRIFRHNINIYRLLTKTAPANYDLKEPALVRSA